MGVIESGKVKNQTGTVPRKVAWYRSPVGREDMARLNARSDFKGILQTVGFLGFLALTGASFLWSVGHLSWVLSAAFFFFHATCFHFLINGFHELVHDSVFKKKFLNRFFLRIFSFLGWYNHHGFWASHTEHHKFTLHPPDDLEVVLPQTFTVKRFLTTGFVHPNCLLGTLKNTLRIARGKVEGEWENHLFPVTKPEARLKYRNWARILLIGHASILIGSLVLGTWFVPLVTTVPMIFGGWLHFLCNNTQHAGLQDNVPDFRLCTRTIYLNPFLRFLYWNMNYHTEHHMYAAVPCYNLAKLHALIKKDLPHCPNGLVETWKEIIAIQRRQKADPSYRFIPVNRSDSKVSGASAVLNETN